MKCYYYLSPTLAETASVSDDLHKSGVNDWFIHVISKNEAGLQKRHIHSSNYLETMDLVRDGVIGGVVGFCVGMLFAVILSFFEFELFGTTLPALAYLGIAVLFTGFGAWQGGLIGISAENHKLRPFHDEIAAGKYLILVYAHKNAEAKIHSMMSRLHPSAQLAGYDHIGRHPRRCSRLCLDVDLVREIRAE